MRCLITIFILLSPINAAAIAPVQIPLENRAKGNRPSFDSATALARDLLRAISADTPAAVDARFFPAESFLALKAILHPQAYYQQLRRWYALDIHREHQRLGKLESLNFVALHSGHCVWKRPGSEANKIPYWSCYENQIIAQSSRGEVNIALHAMINWGPNWYVTHLGPVHVH